MRRRVLSGLSAVFVLAMVALSAEVASAQSGPESLATAESAYSNVDFEQARAAATEAITLGGLSPTELVRAYQLVGVSCSALGDSAAARDAFVQMVSIDPDARLDDTVPPRLRAPFLEARGQVSGRSGRLSAEVQLARAYGALRIALSDPFELVVTVRMHARVEGEVEFTTSEFDPEPEIMARHSGATSADRMEYWLEALDGYGNQVLLVGTEYEPRVVGRLAAVAAGTEGGAAGGGGPGVLGEPVFWIIVGVVAAAGLGVGIGFAIDSQSHVGLSTQVSFGL
jgi:hypothetical protein